MQVRTLTILIARSGNGLTPDVYRKNIYTGLGLKFVSFEYNDIMFKINSIKTLIHRAYNICSD